MLVPREVDDGAAGGVVGGCSAGLVVGWFLDLRFAFALAAASSSCFFCSGGKQGRDFLVSLFLQRVQLLLQRLDLRLILVLDLVNLLTLFFVDHLRIVRRQTAALSAQYLFQGRLAFRAQDRLLHGGKYDRQRHQRHPAHESSRDCPHHWKKPPQD